MIKYILRKQFVLSWENDHEIHKIYWAVTGNLESETLNLGHRKGLNEIAKVLRMLIVTRDLFDVSFFYISFPFYCLVFSFFCFDVLLLDCYF